MSELELDPWSNTGENFIIQILTKGKYDEVERYTVGFK